MTEDRLTELRNKLFRACEGHDVDMTVRAMGSALTTMIIGCTADRDAALAALERIVAAMRQHVEDVARPEDAKKQ
jgi:RNA:NAD 2'-phosphotransferase (TPT1/KptA family)